MAPTARHPLPTGKRACLCADRAWGRGVTQFKTFRETIYCPLQKDRPNYFCSRAFQSECEQLLFRRKTEGLLWLIQDIPAPSLTV